MSYGESQRFAILPLALPIPTSCKHMRVRGRDMVVLSRYRATAFGADTMHMG